MAVIKTSHDGWDCVPQLKSAVNSLSDIQSEIYEIKNCKRESDLEDLVSALTGAFEEALEELNSINVDNEFETVDD